MSVSSLPNQNAPLFGSLPSETTLRQRLAERRRIPSSTYRLQLHKGFTLEQANAIIPYLESLGISDCYTSPLLKAQPGSTHGYDITDHRTLNPELGDEAKFATFISSLKSRHMGLLLDFVPNHMGADPKNNAWWRDVLENGSCSPFARFFDIDWDPVKIELRGKVLLPILGDQYGRVLGRGELKLVFQAGEGLFEIHYFDNHLPVNPRQLPLALRLGLDKLRTEFREETSEFREFLSIITSLDNLPSTDEKDPDRIGQRQREKEVARERLKRLVAQAPRIGQHIQEALATINDVQKPDSFKLLHQFLEGQAYRLAYWRTASHEINYRRFFEINQLAGIRMENPTVFAATHALLLRWMREGAVTGVRMDHPDGLYDPATYFDAVQQAAFYTAVNSLIGWEKNFSNEERLALETWRAKETASDPAGPAARPLYVLAEKILSTGEVLPQSWGLHGTSGYDYVNIANGVFVSEPGATALRVLYDRLVGQQPRFETQVYLCKKLIMTTTMASELTVLAHALNRLSEENPSTRDFTLESLREALREVVACFPVYRTYINENVNDPSDRQVIVRTVARAKRRNPAMEDSIFAFIQNVLLAEATSNISPSEHKHYLEFAMKFQQYTGPVQAKGLEDTLFYRYNVLISLNEVGGDPRTLSTSPERYHTLMAARTKEWPYTMLGSSTHDTKRGEDARARINVISEMPELWETSVRAWMDLNKNVLATVDDERAPDVNDEYLFYQTLLGVWPADLAKANWKTLAERLQAYMQKALKEAKEHSSWINPNEGYEKAVAEFVQKTLLGAGAERFHAAFDLFAQKACRLGMVNSLAQLVLKLTSPGVPDVYQGSELWDLSLVDPDNRRPVDYALRAQYLKELEPVLKRSDDRSSDVKTLLDAWADGKIKMLVLATLLRLRQAYLALFTDGAYKSLSVTGDKAAHALAFARQDARDMIVTLVPRLSAGLTTDTHALPLGDESWGTTALILDKGTYKHAVTGETFRCEGSLRLADVLRHSPVAVLIKQ